MRKLFLFFLFGFFLFFFVLSSQAIVGVKLQELRFGILRDQLMNYELSSQTLRERLKQMFLSKDDYLTEIKVNILESGIMNSELQETDIRIGYRDRLGLAVINFVRLLNFKPSLELEEQQKTILRLQFAFYMERTRKFPIASKKYQELEDDNQNSLSDEMAFTLLHHGYCLVMMGDRDRAFVKLTKVRDLFPGTHYAENASLLISFIEENKKKKEDLKSKSKKPEELAYSLFQSGDYEETLRTLESLPSLTKDQSYIKARAMEELGRTSNAVQEYIQLVKQKENRDVAVRANRRLLLIGNFYQENKSIVAFSKAEAMRLGDSKAAENIEEGKSLVLKPVIIEKILSSSSSETLSKDERQEIENIKESIKLSLNEAKDEETKLAEVVTREKIPEVKENEIPEKQETKTKETLFKQIKVKLRDGREILCDQFHVEGGLAILKLGDFGLNLPLDIVQRLESQNKGANFKIKQSNGNITESSILTRTEQGDWIGKNDKEPIPNSELKEIWF
ncbi:MAG: hypothetical protein O9301_07890 [Leptospira sp.]|nr:hypothetical protein [Leptospira sp.]